MSEFVFSRTKHIDYRILANPANITPDERDTYLDMIRAARRVFDETCSDEKLWLFSQSEHGFVIGLCCYSNGIEIKPEFVRDKDNRAYFLFLGWHGTESLDSIPCFSQGDALELFRHVEMNWTAQTYDDPPPPTQPIIARNTNNELSERLKLNSEIGVLREIPGRLGILPNARFPKAWHGNLIIPFRELNLNNLLKSSFLNVVSALVDKEIDHTRDRNDSSKGTPPKTPSPEESVGNKPRGTSIPARTMRDSTVFPLPIPEHLKYLGTENSKPQSDSIDIATSNSSETHNEPHTEDPSLKSIFLGKSKQATLKFRNIVNNFFQRDKNLDQ
jgi:hypothetical protein